MTGILQQLLDNQRRPAKIIVESAGVSDGARQGGSAPKLSQALAPTYGLNLSHHQKRHIDALVLSHYDLFIAAEKDVQAALYDAGVTSEVICLELAGAANAWKSENSRKVEDMIHSIYQALLREVIAYKFKVE